MDLLPDLDAHQLDWLLRDAKRAGSFQHAVLMGLAKLKMIEIHGGAGTLRVTLSARVGAAETPALEDLGYVWDVSLPAMSLRGEAFKLDGEERMLVALAPIAVAVLLEPLDCQGSALRELLTEIRSPAGRVVLELEAEPDLDTLQHVFELLRPHAENMQALAKEFMLDYAASGDHQAQLFVTPAISDSWGLAPGRIVSLH